MRNLLGVAGITLILILPLFGEEIHKGDFDTIPKAVMEGLKGHFPKAKITQWSKELEGEITVYDFEFMVEGMKLEADVREDGSIFNWEKAIPETNLSDITRNAALGKYPGSSFTEVMEISGVSDGRDFLEGYEILLKTSSGKVVEIMVAPDGKILENSSDEENSGTDDEPH